MPKIPTQAGQDPSEISDATVAFSTCKIVPQIVDRKFFLAKITLAYHIA